MFAKQMAGKLAICAMGFGAITAQAALFTLDFEGVGNQVAILDFYNGGNDGAGNSGTNFGVRFGSNTLGIIDQDAGGTGNFGNEPTPDTVMFFLTGSAVLNYAPGFVDGFSFYYTTSLPASVKVYDGLDATGNLLGSNSLSRNIDGCTGDPSGTFCNWDIGSLAFAGTAKSIDFGGTVNQVGFDNITFGSIDPNQGGGNNAPEPASLA